MSHEGIDTSAVTVTTCDSGKRMAPWEDGKLLALAEGDIQLNIGCDSDVVAMAAGFLKIFAGGRGFGVDAFATTCFFGVDAFAATCFCFASFDALLPLRLDARAAA